MLIIADNQPLTRDALASYFGNQSVHFAMSKDEVSHLLQQTPTGSVILDFSLFDFSTPEHMLIYLRRFPQSHWLLLSAEFTENLLRLLGSEPQVSFLLKDCSKNDVLQAVYKMEHGERVICAQVHDVLANGVQKNLYAQQQLTHTEEEILRLIAQGMTAKAIAAERHSSVHTIVTHKKNIFRKLGVSTTYEATRYALRAGIVELVEYYI